MADLALRLARVAIWIATSAILVATLLPLWDSNRWWVRILDFPRLQIAILGGAMLIAALFLLPGPGRWLVPALMIAACGYQIARIFPYTPLAPTEIGLAPDAPDSVSILSANVLMENRDHDAVARLIGERAPDILLLMETDQRWVDALAPVLETYDTVLREPKDNHYGMVFATRLPVEAARITRLTTDDTPSVFAELTGPGGRTFRFVGLHPRPPMPGQSTRDRDAQIYYAARFAAKSGVPLIVTGDFNDVAWSDTSRLFKHVGQYVDPRIGRGFFASFDAKKPFWRFPIDQFYATPDVAVVGFERLRYVGSDHFPIAAVIRLDAELAGRLNTPPAPLSEEQEGEVRESVARTRKLLGHAPP
ncbi:endonuclease/exonuclease/phosphatase family protein [Amaricoccus solimangrovi]|uniref:Endonuclease/exonuclease/phosphatase family protein n=1 Tax=Amaricoccus solimangrovi TaxID=2589815 RepID=A0A501X0A2_9RHOB|nr:endonuclease/exonuclease/phosphatase family protein [Amaricoccus solimangrovi]TPE53687.1 endonuclease/exonuclease/phosphatase family protein [Amaricoccus solimangrovi]